MSTRFGKVLENLGKLPADETPRPLTPPQPTAPAKLGRPLGKKSNPDYVQVTVYLHKDVHRTAKKILLDEGREFSDLVDSLVGKWIQTSNSPEV